MFIHSLKLNNFRNFESYDLEPQKVTILIGPNGVGKTNLLEAIYILSVCRSYRTRRDAEIIGWNQSNDNREVSPARGEIQRGGSTEIQNHPEPLLGKEGIINGSDTGRVSAELVSDNGDKVNIAIAQTGDKKIAFLGEKQVPVSMLVGTMPTVIFVPEIMDLPEASPTKRRRNFDIHLAQIEPHYTQTLLKYNQILKARNKLLLGISMGRNKENELDFWDKQLVELGKLILKTRTKEAEELNKHVITCYNRISKYPLLAKEGRRGGSGGDNYHDDRSKRKLGFKYHSSVSDIDRFEEELAASRDQELRYGNTIIGPHRDDWQMNFSDVDIRMAASRGETRAALLALKMAEMEILRIRRNEMPILLLDDVFAELDRHHSESLLEFIDGNANQELYPERNTVESKGYNKESLRCADTLTQTVKSSPQIFITATDAEYIPESIKKKARIVKL